MHRPAFPLVLLALTAASLAGTGCGSFRDFSPLTPEESGELARLRESLAGRTIRVAEPSGRHMASHALRECGFDVVPEEERDAEDALSVRFADTTGGPLRDPWLTVFGVFVIPVWTDAEEDTYVVSDGPLEVLVHCPIGVPRAYGWLAHPLRILPGWRGWVVYVPNFDREARSRRIALEIARSLVKVGGGR